MSFFLLPFQGFFSCPISYWLCSCNFENFIQIIQYPAVSSNQKKKKKQFHYLHLYDIWLRILCTFEIFLKCAKLRETDYELSPYIGIYTVYNKN